MKLLAWLFKSKPKKCGHIFQTRIVYGNGYHVPGPRPIVIDGRRIDGYVHIPHTLKIVCLFCGEAP